MKVSTMVACVRSEEECLRLRRLERRGTASLNRGERSQCRNRRSAVYRGRWRFE